MGAASMRATMRESCETIRLNRIAGSASPARRRLRRLRAGSQTRITYTFLKLHHETRLASFWRLSGGHGAGV